MDSATQYKNTDRYKHALKLLKDHFGYYSFKPRQYDVIDSILNEKDCLAIFPTGYGKSILFQIPPLISGELAVVVSPLIALMQDQHSSMEKAGIKSCCFNSTNSVSKKNKITTELINGEYQILYITPESLVRQHEMLDQIYSSQGICMICIDEAHCISSYGNDFRPSYREISMIRKLFPNVPVLAVTATATDRVVQDIATVMEMSKSEVIRASFDRTNLKIYCQMQRKKSEQTFESIFSLIKPDEPMIIYCLTKNDTEKIAEYITEAGIECRAYHAGLTNKIREKVQNDFMNGTVNCISATIAFGMGINKQNIRKVVHYGCPQNIESYYQEIGRAGRDGKESECWLYYKDGDFMVQKRFIEQITNHEYKKTRMELLQVMSRYVTIGTCYRKYILNYFGENYDQDNCSMCSNCLTKKKNISNEKKKEMKIIDKIRLMQIINTVQTLGNSYGTNTIALILKGSGSKKITDRMKRTQYYGGMQNMKLEDIGNLIIQNIQEGYLKSHDLGNMIRVIHVTPMGTDFCTEFNSDDSNLLKRDMYSELLICTN